MDEREIHIGFIFVFEHDVKFRISRADRIDKEFIKKLISASERERITVLPKELADKIRSMSVTYEPIDQNLPITITRWFRFKVVL